MNYMKECFKTDETIADHLTAMEEYRPYSPSLYLYNGMLAIDLFQEYDKAIVYSYMILKAWNMDSRGAQLAEYFTYKDCLQKCKDIFLSLQGCNEGKLYRRVCI